MNELAAASRPPTSRLLIGGGLFLLGFASPVFIPLVMKSTLSIGWKSTLTAFLTLGIPELFMIIAAGVLGRSGFEYLKSRLKRESMEFLAKHGPPERVGTTRYRVGLILFSLPLVAGWLLPYAQQHVPRFDSHGVFYGIVGDGLLATSLFVLGGGFWDKLRALFIHGARAQFPGSIPPADGKEVEPE